MRTSRHLVLPHAGSESRGPHRAVAADPADLAARLRDLTLRSHRLVHQGCPDAESLRALRAAILDLEADLLAQNLPGLTPFVQALRHRVEAQLH
jgi:hypothetical protein